MRAVTHTTYGPPTALHLTTLPKPTPTPTQILVRIHLTTVGRTDAAALRAHPFFIRLVYGLFRPRWHVLGMEFVGVVEAVGAQVERFAVGQRVFGIAPEPVGAHAEWRCFEADAAVECVPDGVGMEECLVCEGGFYANEVLRKLPLRQGQRVMIYGASGAIGTAAVQLAKYYGAEVTAVAATRHMDLLRQLGADLVYDYTKEDYTAGGKEYDFVVDAVGKTTYFRCKRVLKKGGSYASTDLGPWWQNIWMSLWSALTRSRRVMIPVPESPETAVKFMRDRVEAGELRPVIDRRYPLEDIREAFRYVDTEQKVGVVVIQVSE